MLEAGIDVFSTVNVQHLESLNDQVAQLTGATVRETIPDAVLSDADEVVLVDLTPEALIARLRAGKVYRPERVPAALNNFFKIENLAALRETALRQVAEDVEVKRLVSEDAARCCAATRRACACSTRPGPRRSPSGCSRSVTLGAGLRAGRCAAPGARPSDWTPSWTCWSSRPPGRPGRARRTAERLEELRRLASMLGARLRVEEGEDVAAVAIRAAHGARHHLRADGHAARAARASRRFGGGAERSLLMRLLTGLPGVDVRVVADPTLRRSASCDAAEAAGSAGPRLERAEPRRASRRRGRPSLGCGRPDSRRGRRARPLTPHRLATPSVRTMPPEAAPARLSACSPSCGSVALLVGLAASPAALGQQRQAACARRLLGDWSGIGDEHGEDVREPAVAAAAHEDRPLHRALRRGRARRRARQGASEWIHAAETQHEQVLVAFYHSEHTPTKLPSVATYQADVKKFVKDFPHVHQYQS